MMQQTSRFSALRTRREQSSRKRTYRQDNAAPTKLRLRSARMTQAQWDRMADNAMALMRADLITVNEARRRVGSEPLSDGDRYFSETDRSHLFAELPKELQ